MSSVRVNFPLVFLIALLPRLALAQTSASEKALSSQLFDEARALVKAGHAEEACPKFAESQRLDAQLGTLIHLANCYEKVGKTASAWALFREAAGLTEQRKDKREALAKERRDALEAVLSKIKFQVSASAPADLQIQQDGLTVGNVVWGTPVPVDPGLHQIRVRAEGYKDYTTTIDVPKGPHLMNVEVPVLERLPERASARPAEPTQPGPAQPVSVPVGQGSMTQQPSQNQTKFIAEAGSRGGQSSSWQSTVGYIAGGIGLVGIGLGTYFVIRSKDMQKERNGLLACVSSQSGCDEFQQLRIDHLEGVIRNDNRIALGGFVAGGALVVTGLVLVLAAPSAHTGTRAEIKPNLHGSRPNRFASALEVQPWIAIQGSGVALQGRW